jgi:hypothetical protein
MQKDSLQTAEVLLENGADIYSESKEGSTPLAYIRSVQARNLLEEYIGSEIAASLGEEAAAEEEAPSDGIRRITYESGAVYMGHLKNEKKHGEGTLVYPNGERYEGEWVNGLKHGYGVYSFPDGEKYEGKWREGKRHGRGTYTYPNGDRLTGLWKNGQLESGSGTYHFADGDVYDGQWRNNMMWGYGEYTAAGGDVFEGYWKANRLVRPAEAENAGDATETEEQPETRQNESDAK